MFGPSATLGSASRAANEAALERLLVQTTVRSSGTQWVRRRPCGSTSTLRRSPSTPCTQPGRWRSCPRDCFARSSSLRSLTSVRLDP